MRSAIPHTKCGYAMLGLLPAVMRYRTERILSWPASLPVNVTLSITNKCNSRCRTCFIWRLREENEGLASSELTAKEYHRIFSLFGRQIVWATLSGGEPYLRADLPEICRELCDHCAPYAVNIPTNGLLPDTVEESTRRVLENCNNTRVIVNLSLDGAREVHDAIRGVPGNFDRALESYARLKKLRIVFPNLRVGIHSVVSRFNVHSLPEFYYYVRGLDPDSHVTEIAQNRDELLNMNENVAPGAGDYLAFVERFLDNVGSDAHTPTSDTSVLIEAFRMYYYKIAAEEVRRKRQIIPCYAGRASVQIAPNGDVWPCCVLGSAKTMGNLRDYDYDFKALWRSDKARDVRKWVNDQHCHCSLANAHYTNILCNFSLMPKVLWQCLKRIT
jgi:radical SAM protein with 4Fe4S-binding SPASM domain